jgi:NAD(P)-dependent dehydrogenase (short-subunit alcohol dehydrogenase family)
MTDTGIQKVALITGGNRGLGRSTALALAQAGTDVVITYRSGETEAASVVAEVEAQGRTAVALRLDTTEIETFPAFVDSLRSVLSERWGRETLDHLVNNAGLSAEGSIGEATPDDVQLLFDVHFKGVFFLTQALLPVLADGGSIVNLSTGLARFVGVPSYAVYASMKGAVEVLTRYLAKELGARGIRVNVVAPGPVMTDFAGGYIRDNPEIQRRMGETTALGRVGEPDDIGPVIAAVLSDAMGWVTAQRIEASGGTLL